MSKRILFYSPYGTARVHRLPEITVAKGLELRGAEVTFLCCDALFKDCDAFWERWLPKTPEACKGCMQMDKDLFVRFGLKYEWMSEYLSIEVQKTAQQRAESIPAQELPDTLHNNYRLGQYAFSSLLSHYRISRYDAGDQKVVSTFRNYLYGAYIAYEALTNFFDSFRPDVLFMFNGRFFSHQIALQLAKKRNIRVIVHERGATENTLRFFENESCQEFATFKKCWEEWEGIPMQKSGLHLVRNILQRRIMGQNTNWFSYVSEEKNLDDILSSLSMASQKSIVTFFTSSEDEFAASKAFSALVPQKEIIERTVAFFREMPEHFLIIRVHPNTPPTEHILHTVRPLKKNPPENVRVIMPDEKINSYQLAHLSQACIAYVSTISLEIAAMMAKPVLICGGQYHGQPFSVNLSKDAHYETLLKELLEEKESLEHMRWAYRFAYHCFVRMNIPFPLVSITEVLSAKLTYHSPHALMPGKDENLDRICHAILQDSPIYPPPRSDETFSSINEEDMFLADGFSEIQRSNEALKVQISEFHDFSRPGRFLFVCHNVPPYEYSGTPIITLKQAKEFKKRGKEVAILIPDGRMTDGFLVEQIDGIRVFKVPRINREWAFFEDLHDTAQLASYKKIISGVADAWQPEVVHVNDYVDMPAHLLKIFSNKGALVIRQIWNDEEICHRISPVINERKEICTGPESVQKCVDCYRSKKGPEVSSIKGKIASRFSAIRSLYDSVVNGVIFSSESFRNHFTQFIPIRDEKISCIPHGIEKKEMIDDATLRGNFSGTVTFTFLGNFVDFRKGMDILIQALEELTNLDFCLNIHGTGPGEGYPPIENAKERFKGKILDHGPYRNEQIPCILQKADVGIVPSYFETYSLVLREFLSLGKPVITSDFFGSEIITNGHNGFRVPVGDSQQLGARMREIIKSPPLLQKLRTGACVTKINSVHEECDLLLNFYSSLMRKKHFSGSSKDKPLWRDRICWKETGSFRGDEFQKDQMKNNLPDYVARERKTNTLMPKSNGQEKGLEEAYQGIKGILINNGKYEPAIYALEKFLESHPDYSPAHNDLGVLYYNKGDKEKARIHYERAVSLNPGNPIFLKNLADFYYVELKRIDEATKLYEKILSVRPQDTETLLILGNIHVELGKLHDAKGYYSRVLEVDPANELASQLLQALKEQEHEAGVDPEEAYQEVQSLIQSGNRDEAKEGLEKFLQVYPNYAQAHNDLGNLYYIMGYMEKALPHLEKSVHLKPDNIKFLKTLADFYLAEVGNVEEALKVYNHVLVLQPSDIETLLILGNICAAQRQFRDAKFFFLRVLDLEPQNLHAHENLEALSRLEQEERAADQSQKVYEVCQSLGESEVPLVAIETNYSCDNGREASIIIPVFNQMEYTARCLEVLYKNTSLEEICEVIVINNGSTDDTEKYLEKAMNLYPKLLVLSNKENYKFARACNHGARVAKGKYLVFMNNDTEPLPGWLSLGLKRIKSDDKIGVVGSKLLYPDRRIQHCGIEFMRGINPSHIIWPEHRLRYASEDDPRVNIPEEVQAVTGACLFIERGFFLDLGGFEESYGMYFEDTDLCFKVREKGKMVFYEPRSVVIHYEGKSSLSREIIDSGNVYAANLFYKKWKEQLIRIEFETLIEKQEEKFVYLSKDFWPDEVNEENIIHFHQITKHFPPFYAHFGGAGDALLLLSTFYDQEPEQTIVSIANSVEMMRAFFEVFPRVKKVYLIPFPSKYIWHFLARKLFKIAPHCRGLGATPTSDADYGEWNEKLDIFKEYKIVSSPLWIEEFKVAKLQPVQITIQPKGSLRGMVGSKRNLIDHSDWIRLLCFFEKKNVRPIIIGTPDEVQEFPCVGKSIDKRSYSFREQMQLIASSDFFIGADSWGKTFSSMAGVPAFVFHARRGSDLRNWKDASDYIFLDPWKEIKVVKSIEAFEKHFNILWNNWSSVKARLGIRWEGSQFVHHSLALINRELCLRLIEAGFEVSIIPYEADQFGPEVDSRFIKIAERTKKPLSGPAVIHVRHQWPPNFTPPTEGHWVIIQPWEFGSLPKTWVEVMGTKVDEMWVPTNYVRDCYVRSGVPAERVFVVPNGVDTRMFNSEVSPFLLKTKKKFKFLFVGGTIYRKGIDILLEVYTKEFTSSDDVCLVIKDMGGQSFYQGQTAKELIKHIQADPNKPEIEYIEQILDPKELAGLYTACDCLVHPYRGEGFGLPIAEAMASSLPVIVTNYGASLDFCHNDIAYMIPALERRLSERRIGNLEMVNYPWLAEPDKKSLAGLMRHVATHPDEAKIKGSLAREFIQAHFTWDRAAEIAMKRMRELCTKPVLRFEREKRAAKYQKSIINGMVSIIIPVTREARHIKECVHAIRKWTPEPHEIIFIDINSSKDIKKWLKMTAGGNNIYKIIHPPKPPNPSGSFNHGIRESSGKFIVLLEPDVVVTENWLSGMIECLKSDVDAGIVGAMTNNVGGLQKAVNADYGSMGNLDAYAKEFREKNRYRRILARRIVGFCMLFRRELVEKIGLLDETFGSGNYEDDDFCLRASLEGYRNIIAGDVFIHHYGSRSFIGDRIDYNSSRLANRKIFNEKWNGLETDSPLGQKALGLKTMEKADELNQRGQNDEAVNILVGGIKLFPGDKRLYYMLSEILIDLKRYKDALSILNEIPANNDDTRKLALIGYGKEGMELYEEAQEYADCALSLNPNFPLALNLKGILAYKKGDKSAAESFFKKAIEADQGYGEPYTNLGVLKWGAEQKEEALNFLEKGFILSPTIADIVTAYYSAITATAEFSRAERVFQEAKGLYPLNRRIAFLLIDILIQQGENNAAMENVEEAMIAFGVDDGILSAAIEMRSRIGIKEIDTKTKRKSTLSLCMIVKNEEEYLPKCLRSVEPVVDEMIIVDTGSTDRTKEIAQAFGAKVYELEWTESFAEARNYSISKASGQWILVMDADEVLSSRDYDKLARLIKDGKPAASAYSLITKNYVDRPNVEGWRENDGAYAVEEAGTGWFPSQKVRLFPHDSRIRFENPVHEFVEPSLSRAGINKKLGNIFVHHYGKLDEEKSLFKGEAYYNLGKRKLDEMGRNVDALRELAIQAAELKKFDEAVELWKKIIFLQPDNASAYLNLGHAYVEFGKYEDALLASKKAMELDPKMKEAVHNYSICELCSGRVQKAITALETLLRRFPGYLSAIGLLGVAYIIDGRIRIGLEYIEKLWKNKNDAAEYFFNHAARLFKAGMKEYVISLLEAAIESKNFNEAVVGLLEECKKNADFCHECDQKGKISYPAQV